MTRPAEGICEGVCQAQKPRAVFASGLFRVCLSCLTSPTWVRERARREAESDKMARSLIRVPLVRG